MKIILFIRQLNDGGAQRQLTLLACGLARAGHNVHVVTFYGNGHFLSPLQACGVPVVSLEKHGRWDIVPFFIRWVRCLRRLKPQVVYSFLGVANILAVLGWPFLAETRIVWSVRSSFMDLAQYDWLHRASFHLECLLSRFADLVIANSAAGRDYALANGFPDKKTIVIANGIDTDIFRPDPVSREEIRAEWGVNSGEKLIGLVGRLDPMKDHPTFLRAAVRLVAHGLRVRFVCVGSGPEAYRMKLMRLAVELGLEDRVLWAGARSDIPAVLNALDVLVSSSYGEGFPNVVGEAMACGVPCVVTDVGDSAAIVGEGGLVVPPRDPERLAQAIERLIVMLETGELSVETARLQCTRERIVAKYSAAAMVRRTELAILGILNNNG